jgi:hypothetical protein
MAVDSSGKVIGQRIEWVPGGVPGFADAGQVRDSQQLLAARMRDDPRGL